MVTVFILENILGINFLNVHIKLNLQNFSFLVLSFKRSAVTNENSIGRAGSAPPPPPLSKIGLRKRLLFSKVFKMTFHQTKEVIFNHQGAPYTIWVPTLSSRSNFEIITIPALATLPTRGGLFYKINHFTMTDRK